MLGEHPVDVMLLSTDLDEARPRPRLPTCARGA
jgi:hypothetical protein